MFYRLSWFVTKFIFYGILFRSKIIGAENVPKKGGAILCANHISNYDPITVAVHTWRPVHFMAKKELFAKPAVKLLIEALKAFPVDRDKTDMNAFKTAIQLLKGGELVGIFAQGTRVKEGEDASAKAGVALLAVKSNVPVIPVAISGQYKKFQRMHITFGKPISLEEYAGRKVKSAELTEIADKIMAEVEALRQVEE